MRINSKFQIPNYKLTNLARSWVKHPLFSGSAIMILGSTLANFLGYIYHLIMGRLLGPSAYGELAVSLSALGMLAVSFSFLGLVVVKFISGVEEGERSKLIAWFINKALYLGLFLLFLLIVLSPLIAEFLHLSTKITLLFGPATFFFLFSLLYKSFLQGLIKFKESAALIIADVLFRLISGVALVLVGLAAFGAVFGIAIGALSSFILGVLFLRRYYTKDGNAKVFGDGGEVWRYSLSVFIISLTSTSFISSDVILVKHFFSAYDAGIYSSLSTLGKIIYYGAGPVSAVMFPLISYRHSRDLGYKKVLIISIFLTLFIAGAVLIIYWLFPELSVRALYGSKFISASNSLVWFGLFMLIFTISNLIISFYLSIEKTKIAYVLPFFALAQIIGIAFYHETIRTVINVSILSTLALLIFLLVYFAYDKSRIKSQ